MRGNCWRRAPDGHRRSQAHRYIRNNSERVSTIINNVLQLSRREATKPARLMLGDWLEDFFAEFSEPCSARANRCAEEADELEVRFDPATCIKWFGTCATTPSSTASPATVSESRSSWAA